MYDVAWILCYVGVSMIYWYVCAVVEDNDAWHGGLDLLQYCYVLSVRYIMYMMQLFYDGAL